MTGQVSTSIHNNYLLFSYSLEPFNAEGWKGNNKVYFFWASTSFFWSCLNVFEITKEI